MNYFYILTRDKNIHELDYEEEKYKATLNAWNNGKIIFAKSKGESLPYGINSADITQILTGEKYSQWIKSASPKRYIKAGTWYDGKENNIIKHEPWKELEMVNQLKLKESNVYTKGTVSKERWDEFRKDMARMFPGHKWK